eukprot:TRINITY_DN34408_c0_g1_i1.p3 TRINITY_DN34408_c0_g1~~TRINITY_DN34408_c0_g1_i1.p3  ORF type:complete len:103 (+),score=5.86 TRINITY_DN34408_c0_g1_i1:735-1043(+)
MVGPTNSCPCGRATDGSKCTVGSTVRMQGHVLGDMFLAGHDKGAILYGGTQLEGPSTKMCAWHDINCRLYPYGGCQHLYPRCKFTKISGSIKYKISIGVKFR